MKSCSRHIPLQLVMGQVIGNKMRDSASISIVVDRGDHNMAVRRMRQRILRHLNIRWVLLERRCRE
ncbi:hypothetical protein [Candidatus Alkanophaga liquidiphilum]